MKRKLALVTTSIMICSILAGCGKTQPGPDNSGTTGLAASAADTTAQDGSGEISFPLPAAYTVEAFAFSNTGQELDKTLTMQVMEEKTNIHWDLSTVSEAELEEKRNLSFNGGEYYDVYIKSGIDAIDTYKYALQGIVIPLNDLIDQYMPNLKKQLDAQDAWGNITSADGNIYALPQLNGPELSAAAVYINTPWLEKVGMDAPKTQKEFLEVLRAFRDQDPNGNGKKDEYPIYCPGGAVNMLMPIFGIAMDWNTMSMYDIAAGTITYVPASEEYKNFLGFMADVYKEGLINQDCYTATWDDINAIGATQDAIGVMATYGAYQHVGTERDEDYDGLMPFDGKHSMPAGKGINYGALLITDKCTRPELICSWADYLYSEEGAILGHMGVEGETFTLDDDGKYHWKTDGEWGSDITTIRNTATLFGWYPAPLAKARLFDEGQSNPEELFLNQQRQRLLEYAAEPFPTLSWTEAELEEKSTLVTSINTYIDEYQALVVTGQTDPESSWDGYLTNLKGMGMDRLNEIDSAAYNRWLEENK